MDNTNLMDQRVHILLIDDSELIREIIGIQLEEWGYSIATADSGRAGIEYFEKRMCDVVICDIVMPDIDGLEVLRELRARLPDVAVIMLSNYSQIETVLEAVRLGAFDYVIKDERLEPLHAAIERALSHIRLLRENRVLLEELHEMNQYLERSVHERTRQLEQANRRLTLERGELERTLHTLHDTQTQLVQAEKMASVGLLTAGVAHEINNPLAFLLPNFSLLEECCQKLDQVPDAERKSIVQEIQQLVHECREGLHRIRDIIKELSLFSRKSDSVTDRINLEQLIDSVFKLFSSQIRRAKLRTYVSGVADICGDPGQLRQVLLNLLINAAHAIPADSETGEIIIKARNLEDYVEVRVIDNGVGIPADHLSKVFDPFFTTKSVGQGTGMGLAISRQLVERMGGKIAVESQTGRGTTMIVTLPASKTRTGEPSAKLALKEKPQALQPAGDPLKPPTILVVDDEEVFLSSIARVLSAIYDVVGLKRGGAALEWLAKHQAPDLVLCDLIMPEMSGIEFYHLACKRFPLLDKRFIFVTGGAVTNEARAFVECDGCRVVEKPLEVDEILEMIDTAIGRKQEIERQTV